MTGVRIVNQTRDVDLAPRGELGSSFLSRAIGLMGRSSLAPGYGLALPTHGPIHMFFMRVPLDVCHVAKDGRVLRILHDIKPWRMGPHVRGSTWVVELPVGTVDATGTVEGDILTVLDASGRRLLGGA
ncbi:MAG: DUF192 domain-containing protein [Chloroflexota bacterium]